MVSTATDHQQLYHELKRFVNRRVKSRTDAEDIVHDVFVKAQLKEDQLKEAEKFTAWIYQITRNSIIDYYRKKKKVLDEPALTETEEYNLFNDCVFRCLQQLMHTLPSPYREAILLAEVDQVPQKELAVRLGISYSGAKSRVQRARQMLKEKMTDLYHIRTDGFGNVVQCENRQPCGCESHEVVTHVNQSPI
ncbi:MAG: sigma-70 family RNA polymerase sigma factor [Bacteroidota bacterium]